MIKLEKVTKIFAASHPPAVAELSLDVPEGQLLVLLGQSGSGKTTVLRMINRLIDATTGRISLEGQNIDSLDPISLRRRIGYVFQGIGLFPHMTVAENVGIVPQLLQWSERDVHDRTNELLSMVGLSSTVYGDRYPHELSGGQQQRVGVARALAARQKIVLMDEPFGALDPITRSELQTNVLDLKDRLGLTIVLVTHDVAEALLMADSIAVLKDGHLLAQASPRQLVAEPGDDFIRQLIATPLSQAAELAGMLR